MKKLSISLLLLAIMIISISAVSAADEDVSDDLEMPQTDFDTLEVDSVDEDVSQVTDDVGTLSAGTSKNFTQLQSDLSSGFLNLGSDYVRAEGETEISISDSVVIIGNGAYKIDANNLGGIFNVGQTGTLTLNNLVLVNGNTDNGGAIYNEGKLNVINTKLTDNNASMGGAIYNTGITSVSGSTLTGNNATNLGGAIYSTGTLIVDGSNLNDNTAKYRGGAIYNEGNLDVSGTTFDSNDITFRTANDENGGAAIYNKEGTLKLNNVRVTNNLKNIVPRDGNSGDLIDAVLFTSGDATVTDSYFANNTGSWGAAIYVKNGATLDVTGTTFEGNNATFGAAIYDEGATINVDDCVFINNAGVGVGSPGTSNTQAGAILVMAQGASATIANSEFRKNKATTGGAVSVSRATGDVLIDNCTFIENTGYYEGGAIYNYIADGATLTVKDSTFTDNTANSWGDAISNDGALKLEGNAITPNNAAIGNWFGTIDSQVEVTILGGEDQTTTNPNFVLTATVTDDQGNTINDHNFVFKVGDDEVDGTYYSSYELYRAGYTFTNPGTYTVTTTGYENAIIHTSDVTFEAPLSTLQTLINGAEDGATIDLSYGFAYLEDYDSALKDTGVVVNKNIIINGNGLIISGADAARLFKVTDGATLTLNNVIITDGAAADGAGVYVDSGAKLVATDTTFKDNVATYSGGAIYTDGGEITLTNCVLDNNDVTEITTNDNTGGAAIYAKNAQVTLTNTNVTNNGKRELDRTNDDLVDAVIDLLNSNAAITGGLFENNTGIYGGAINADGDGSQTLTVTGATFNNNKAYNGAAININDMITTIDDSTFTNNLVVGPGSPGYYAMGGAIAVDGIGSLAVSDSTFTANSATGTDGSAGAIAITTAEDDFTASIDNCVFEQNTAEYKGGAVFANAKDVTISGSTFSDDNEGGVGNAIYNGGTLTLTENTINSDESEIFSTGKINTHVWVVVNNHEDVTVEYYDTIPVVVKITDDAGNLININRSTLTTRLGGTGNMYPGVDLVRNSETGLFEGEIIVTRSGLFYPNRLELGEFFTYNQNQNLNSSYVTMIKADATLEVIYENITYPDDVTITINLIGKEGAPSISVSETGSYKLGVTVNDETYYVKITNGVGTLTIPDLPAGNYVINASWIGNVQYNAIEPQLYNLVVAPKIGTYSDLQYKIEHAENGALDLTYDFAYDETYDGDNFPNGVVIDDSIAINGNGYTISGSNNAALFSVSTGATLTLNNVTVRDTKADKGAGAYVSEGATLDATNVNFIDNTATTKGGAIYSEGTVNLNHATIKDNKISKKDGVMADDNGGAAIYNKAGTVTLNDTKVIDNQVDYVQGDILDGVIVVMGTATINNSYIANNHGRWGGAITVTETAEALTVENTTFEENTGIFGGAIFHDTGSLTVNDCKFYNNSGVGVGSSGTSSTQGGAILVMGSDVAVDIKGSEFINNSADLGGAVSISSGVTGTFAIDDCTFTENKANDYGGAIYEYTGGSDIVISNSDFNKNTAAVGGAIFVSPEGGVDIDECTFTDNTADSEGGALYLWTEGDAVATVKNSKFSGNTAPWGNAISNDGTLSLSNNTVSTTSADIANYYGEIISPINVEVMDNDTYFYHMADVTLTAVVTDDNGNLIKDINFDFTIGDEDTVYARYSDGIYSATYTPTDAGTYVVSMSYPSDNLVVKTATIKFARSLTDLANIVAAANAGDTIVLDGDYAYIAEFDEGLEDGIVIDKDIAIDGKGFTINGTNGARLFNVASGATLTLNNVTISDAKADKGAGVYVNEGATLNADYVTFSNNTATYRGGAIYSEGTVNVDNSVFDKNDITYRSRNDDNGGAAIYNLNGVLNVAHTNITNSVKDIVIRNGNAGDLLVGVVVTTGDTLITDSYFANNTGSWGGAISSLGYMNNEPYTLTVKNTVFEGNNATFGGAIFVESSNLVVDNCTFENNKGVGVGSSGTSNTQGGAIVVFPNGAKATITDSTFTGNSANLGGAVSLAGVDQDSLIENCTFTDNTATSEGGALYLWTQGDAAVSVSDSKFSGNTAPWGNAISNDGTLSLSNNTVSTTSADIANYYGTIISEMNVVILNNETVDFNGEILITAKATDDNGNLIQDNNFDFDINGTVKHAFFNSTSGLYQFTYTNNAPGVYVVDMNYPDETNLIVKTATLRSIKGTYTDLQNQINSADGTLDLTYDFAYNEEIDGAAFIGGVSIADSIAINGNGHEISGVGTAGLFNVATDATLNLNNVTIRDTKADKGAAVYVNEGATLNADYVTFSNNTATYRGGAIYSEGTVNVDNSVFDKNDITYRSRNDDNGGAAIYNMKGTLNIAHTNITNSVKDIVIRNGNAGDLLVGVVVTTGETLITDSYFANNTGSWGGAISSLGYMNEEAYTLTVKNTVFEGNNATFGGAIYVESSDLDIDNCTFENNKGVGVGSSGTSNTQGGAIVVHPAGSSAIIVDSTFIGNSANLGGAVSLAGVDENSIIENCTFTDNTATSEGGALYLWTQGDAAVSVSDSKFSGNTAPWGNAISNDGYLNLFDNEISSTSADIANYYGAILSEVNVEIMENGTYSYHMEDITLSAVITDDNGNLIKDINFNFVIGDTDTEFAYYEDGVYTALFSPKAPGTYVVNMTYVVDDELIVKTATITFSRSLIDLAKIIADARAGETIVVDGDYAYIPEFDESIVNGIVVDKDIIIDGNGTTISGSGLARLFNVTNGATLTLNNVTISDAKADKGAGVYVNEGATLNADYVTFSNNTAVYRGGAIYSEGTVDVDNSVFDKNDITYRSRNDDNGGAAIYNLNGVLNIAHTNITNSVKDIVIRDGNAGDLLVGVVVTSGETLITDSYFANNTGSWGGAISSLGYMNDDDYTLTVKNTVFEGNNATFGGAIFVESSELIVNNCTFENNKGVGVGSSGTSNTQGGAIVVFPNGAKATITDSTFTANSANIGGAVSLAGVDQDSLIENCTFTDNTATSEGGAVYLWTQDGAVVTVKDSRFSGNTAPWGNAISNDGELFLSKNNISSTSADIGNYYGYINSYVNATFLGNQTVPAKLGDVVVLNATLTDDNGNAIRDPYFKFAVNGKTIADVSYDADNVLYTTSYTVETAGQKIISTNYNGAENMEIFIGILDVPKNNATLIVTTGQNDQFPYGENVTVFVGLYDDDLGIGLNDTVNVIINKTPVIVTITDGEGSFNISGFEPGKYAALGIFAGNDNYNGPVYDSTVFEVLYPDRTLSIEVDDIKYGEIAIINITVKDANGEETSGMVVLTVNGTEYAVKVDGKASVEISDLAINEEGYLVNATLLEDTLLARVVNDTESFTVGINTLTFTIEATQDAAYPDNVTITVTCDVDGTAHVTVEGNDGYSTEFDVNVEDGVGTYVLSGLVPDSYKATATYTANGYDEQEENTTFEVVKGTTSFTAQGIDATYGETAYVYVSDLPEDATGNVTVTIDGKPYTAPVEYGSATVAVPDLAVGDYELFAVEYSGDKNYEGHTGMATIIVSPASSSVTIDDIADVTYNASVEVTYTVVNETTVTVVVKDAEGTEITAGVNTTTDGKVIITGLNAGEYTITVSNAGEGNYSESSDEATFKVLKATTTIDPQATGDLVVDAVVNVTFTVPTDIDGMLSVTIDGEPVLAFIVINGTCTIPGTYDAGTHTVVVTLTGDTNYEDAVGQTSFSISKVDPEITISDIAGNVGDTVEATVTIAGGDATGYIFFDGDLYVVENGQATIPVPISTAGMQAISVVYTGDDKYNNGTADKAFNAGKAATAISIDGTEEITAAETATVTVTVDPADATGTVAFTLDGEAYGEPVEIVDGVATIEIPGLTAGNHTITAQYTGDTNYNESEIASMNVAVSLAPTSMEIDSTDAVYGDVAYVLVTGLPEDATGEVTATIGDKTFTAPVEYGEAVIEITDLAAGLYELFDVTYSGDAIYNATSGMITVEITPATSSVVIDDIADVTYNATVEITYTVENETTVTVVVKDAAGTEITTGVNTTIDGKVIITGLDAGEYTIAITNAGDANHTESSDEATFKVLKAAITIDPKATGDLVVDGAVNVTFTVPTDITGMLSVTIDGEPVLAFLVVNGTCTIPGTYDAGTHTVVVTLTDDTNYEDAVGQTSFSISKVNPVITISDIEAIVGDTVDATVTIDGGDATGFILYDGVYYPVENGQATIPVTISTAGMQGIEVVYTGDDKYNNGTANKGFNAGKAATVISIDGTPEITVGEDATITVTVEPADATGTVNITLNGEAYGEPVAINDGIATVTIPGLAKGTYTITAQYTGDTNYNASDVATWDIVVNPASSSVTIDDIADVVYDADVEVTYTVVNETTVSVVVKDADGTEITAGVNTTTAGKVIITGLSAGEYTITVSNAAEGNYSESSDEATFKVLKAAITIDPEATGDLVVDGTVNITFTVPTDITGMLSVDIDGDPVLAFEVINGICTIPGTYDAGTHTVVVTLTGDTNYEDAVGQTSFSISKVDPTIVLAAETGNTAYATKITADIDDDATQYILFTVDGKNVGFGEIKDGKVAITVNNLVAGEHNITATYVGDDKYNEATESIVYAINKLATSITVNEAVFTYGEDAALTINLTDENGNPVVNGLVYVNNTLTVYKYRTNASGIAVAPIKLKPGEYNYTISFNEDSRYEASSINTTVVINKIETVLTAENVTMEYQDGTNYTMKLVDANGNPIKDVTIFVNNGEKTLRYHTDSEGVAVAPINLKPGVYNFTASYAGSAIYAASNMSSTVTVARFGAILNASDITVAYNDGTLIAATLTDLNGEAISDVTIKFDFMLNGVVKKSVRYHTDDNGVAKAPISLKPGVYTCVISFGGNSLYDAISVNVTVNVTKAPTTLDASDANVTYKEGNVTARLVDGNGNGIFNVTVNFDFDGSVYKYRTDSDGVATAPANVKPGEYNCTISFTGNSLYYPADSITKTVVVNKRDATLSVNDVSMTYNDGTKYTVKVTDIAGNPLSGVGVRVNTTLRTGKYYSDSEGLVSVPITLKAGDYDFVAFIDDAVYNPAEATSKVHIES